MTLSYAPESVSCLTVPETAERLGIGTSRAYELCASGRLPAVRIGRSVRVPVAALAEWIKKHVAPKEA